MTKNEMLKVLKDSFKDFEFYADVHYDTYKDKPVGISVTRFIAEYENEFDQLGVAERCAIKQNKSVEEILAEWKYKADFACAKGTTCHEFAQSLWSCEEYNELMFDGSADFLKSVNLILNDYIISIDF